MIIKIIDIEDEAMFSGRIDAKEFRGVYENVDFLGPVDYHLRIQKSGTRLKVDGHVHCDLNLLCARCLEKFRYEIDSDIDVELVPKEMAPTDIEIELERDDLDVHYYESDEVDLTEIIQEEVTLSIPMRAICKEDCKGLCEKCGGNKNMGECKCEYQKDTRLAELLKSYLGREGDNHGSTEEKAIKVKKR